MEPLFPASSEIRRVHREAIVLLGGQRALLMQVAHPLVAQAVAEHSDFPQHAVARLRRTVQAGFGIVFGTPASARAEADRVNEIHERIHGTLPETAGSFRAGTRYDALDPALLAWVHATLADTAMHCFETFVGAVDREAYWRESREVAALFRVPENALPRSVREFDDYVASTVQTLEVSEPGRRLGRYVLRPPIRPVPQIAFAPLRAVTAFLLPEHLREQFAIRMNRTEKAAVRAFARTARASSWILPARLRTVPGSRKG